MGRYRCLKCDSDAVNVLGDKVVCREAGCGFSYSKSCLSSATEWEAYKSWCASTDRSQSNIKSLIEYRKVAR